MRERFLGQRVIGLGFCVCRLCVFVRDCVEERVFEAG